MGWKQLVIQNYLAESKGSCYLLYEFLSLSMLPNNHHSNFMGTAAIALIKRNTSRVVKAVFEISCLTPSHNLHKQLPFPLLNHNWCTAA